MAGKEITRSTRRVNKRNEEKERIKRREKPVAFLSGTERYRSTPGERAPKCDPHAANPARTRVRQRERDWGTEGGRGGEKMTDDDFPTHDDCIHIYVCIYTPETHANGFVHNCRKRRMMIFRSDDPAYVKRGKRRCDLAFLRKQISRIAWNRDRGFPRSHRTPCDAQWFPIRFLRTCWTSFE